MAENTPIIPGTQMVNEKYEYRHQHAVCLDKDRRMKLPRFRYASYTGSNQQLIIWYHNITDTQTFYNVDWNTINIIRAQLRQTQSWFIEAQHGSAIVWNVLGVY